MKTTFISTSSISAATRSSLAKVQQQLADAQKEMTEGRYADVGKTLGFRTGQTISLRQEHSRLNTIVETNSTVSTRLKTTQLTMQNLVDNAQAFAGQLLGSNVGGANGLTVQTDAQSRLEGFLDAMNTTFGDGYLFAGVNSSDSSETRFLPSDQPSGAWTLILPRENDHKYSVDHRDGLFYIRTNAGGAKNYKLVTAPVTNPSARNWTVLIPHRPDVLLEGEAVFKDHLVYQEREDDPFARHSRRMHSKDGLHPSDTGYELWQRELETQVQLSAKLRKIGRTAARHGADF